MKSKCKSKPMKKSTPAFKSDQFKKMAARSGEKRRAVALGKMAYPPQEPLG